MDKFFNDIQTFISSMNIMLKIAMIALLVILDLLVLRDFFKSAIKDKLKIKIVNIILIVIISAMLILVCIYSF